MTETALLDTSVFIAHETGRDLDKRAFSGDVMVSVVTLAELRAGVLTAPDPRLRDMRLRTLSHAMALSPVPVDSRAAEQWASLRMLLLETGQRMGINDSWIAATAMALGVPVLTEDDGFPLLDSLEVIKV